VIFYEYWFFPELERDEVAGAKSRVLEAFWSRGLLEKNNDPDLVLGGKEAYGPTPKLAALFSEGDEVDSIDNFSLTRGMEVCEGFGFRGLELNIIDSVICPECDGAQEIRELPVLFSAIEIFGKSGKIPGILCPLCETSSDARSWKSDPRLTFTYLGFAFWNWRSLAGYPSRDWRPAGIWSFDIPKMMAEAAQSPIAFSYGRL